MYKIILKLFFITFVFNISIFARDININEIINKSINSNKHLFIFLHKSGCNYCDAMLEFTLDDEAVKKLIHKKFIYEHINVAEKDVVSYKDFKGSGHDFAKYIGYNFYPSSLFFDKDSNLIYAAVGYKEEDKFLEILNYVSSGSYNKK